MVSSQERPLPERPLLHHRYARGRCSWYVKLLAHPDFTFHLKESALADLSATARPILDEEECRETLKLTQTG